MYFETHINIKKIAKKIANLQKKLHCFSLFEVLYNWVKFRRLKMGDPVYTSVNRNPNTDLETKLDPQIPVS